jgi:hypothetical protein
MGRPLEPQTRLWVGLAASLLLAGYTGYKLSNMARLRGWLGHVRVERQPIVHKAREDGENGPGCWLSFTERDPLSMGNHRANIDCEVWKTLPEGAMIDVRYLEGDDEPHPVPGAIYDSDGNFHFDEGLLGVELAAAATCGFLLWRRRRRFDVAGPLH